MRTIRQHVDKFTRVLFDAIDVGVEGNVGLAALHRQMRYAGHLIAIRDAAVVQAGITMKLKRGTFTAIFFLACIAALELEQVVLEEI